MRVITHIFSVVLLLFVFFSCEQKKEINLLSIEKFINSNDLLNAELATHELLKKDPENIKLHLLLADILLKKQNYKESFKMLQNARIIDSTDVEVNLKICQFYLFLKQWDLSIKHANDVLKKDRTNAKAYFLKGMVYKVYPDTLKAISNFQTAIEQDVNFYEGYIQLGLLFGEKLDSVALDYYNTALTINRGSTEALYGKAWFYQQKKEWYKALELYNLIPIQAPQYFNAQYNSGYVLFTQKKYRESLAFFSSASRFKVPKAIYMKGFSYEALEIRDSAEIYYKQCLQIDSTYTEAKHRLVGLRR